MSTSASKGASSQLDGSELVRAARPLTAPEIARIEEEARHGAVETGQEIMGEARRGRVEAETRRVSEEMTRRAQEERRREAEHTASAPAQVAGPVAAGDPASRPTEAPPRTLPQFAAIQRVVVPLSSAAFAERAIPYGVALARLAGAPVALVHIGDRPRSESTAALERAAAGFGTDGEPESLTEAPTPSPSGGQLWERVARHLIGIEWLDLPDGPVIEGLLSLEAPDGSDLIVLAARRHTGAEGDTLGAVERALIRQGHAPVFVIAPQVAVPERGLPPLSRVLVPLDGSALAEQALAPVVALAAGTVSERPDGALGASEGIREIVLFSVVESGYALDDAYRYLNDISTALRARLPATVAVVEEVHLGSAPGAIVATAQSGGDSSREHPAPFDLVALATHGRGGLRRWLLGSVAEYVLTRATVPVLVVRPASADE